LIPADYIQEWRARAPWPNPAQVEQDLIICRALCDLFNSPELAGKIAFRGGTAIHKLLFQKPLRYSEDIDLVQTQSEPIGATVDSVREALTWLGDCRRKQARHSMHLIFRYVPEADPETTLNLKIEINTREHIRFNDIQKYPFGMDGRWYQARTGIASYVPEELFGTKLRALLQRDKSRDLFDLNEGLRQMELDTGKIVACLEHYLSLEGNPITRAVAEQRMLEKLGRSLTDDIAPLLPVNTSYTDQQALEAFGTVWTELITRIQGDPWKSTDKVIEELRVKRYPDLLN